MRISLLDGNNIKLLEFTIERFVTIFGKNNLTISIISSTQNLYNRL